MMFFSCDFLSVGPFVEDAGFLGCWLYYNINEYVLQ